MSQEAEYDKLVGLIYEAALEPECWQAVLLVFSDWFSAASTTLFVHDFSNRRLHAESGSQSLRAVRFDLDYLALCRALRVDQRLDSKRGVVAGRRRRHLVDVVR